MDEPSRGTEVNTSVLFRAYRFAAFCCGNVWVRDTPLRALVRYPTNVVLDRAVP
jgi:hypothetical protein